MGKLRKWELGKWTVRWIWNWLDSKVPEGLSVAQDVFGGLLLVVSPEVLYWAQCSFIHSSVIWMMGQMPSQQSWEQSPISQRSQRAFDRLERWAEMGGSHQYLQVFEERVPKGWRQALFSRARNWGTGNFTWTWGRAFLCGGVNTRMDSLPGHIQVPPGCNPVQSTLGWPCLNRRVRPDGPVWSLVTLLFLWFSGNGDSLGTKYEIIDYITQIIVISVVHWMHCSSCDLLGTVHPLFLQHVSCLLIAYLVKQARSRWFKRTLKLLLVHSVHRHSCKPLFGIKLFSNEMETVFSIWCK